MRAYNLYPDAFNSLTPGNPQMAAAVWRLMDRHPAQAQTYDPRQDPELSTLIAQEYYGDSAEVVLQILQMVTAWQLDHTNNSTTPWTYAVGVIGTVGITDGPAGFCSPDRGGGGGGGYGRANNLKGKGFENLVESQFSRQGRNVFYRGRTWGADGFDLVSLEGGTIVLNEAKFQNTTRFDDFTAITRNLKTNIRDVLDRVRGSSSLNTDEQRLVIQTLEMFLEDGITPPNLKIRVISGKGDPIGLRIRARLGRSTGGIPIEYEDFKK